MPDKHISAEALTLSLRDDPNLNAASFARVKRHIEAAPDMVKRGKWDDSFDGITPYCSVCGRSHREMNRTPNFCPNCGADMRGVEDA